MGTQGQKRVFLYEFSSFNIVFTSMFIRIDVEELDSGNLKISLSQLSALKGSTYAKLKSIPLRVGLNGFERSLKDNLKKLKQNLGGEN
jgi:hypothetical protein